MKAINFMSYYRVGTFQIRHNKDNYRGITLLNVVEKIFERLILDRWMPFLVEKVFQIVCSSHTRKIRAV